MSPPPRLELRGNIKLFHGVHHATKAEDVGVVGLSGPNGAFPGTAIKLSMSVTNTERMFDASPDVSYFEGDIEHIKAKVCAMLDSLYRTASTVK